MTQDCRDNTINGRKGSRTYTSSRCRSQLREDDDGLARGLGSSRLQIIISFVRVLVSSSNHHFKSLLVALWLWVQYCYTAWPAHACFVWRRRRTSILDLSGTKWIRTYCSNLTSIQYRRTSASLFCQNWSFYFVPSHVYPLPSYLAHAMGGWARLWSLVACVHFISISSGISISLYCQYFLWSFLLRVKSNFSSLIKF